jgi:hypothetical protein
VQLTPQVTFDLLLLGPGGFTLFRLQAKASASESNSSTRSNAADFAIEAALRESAATSDKSMKLFLSKLNLLECPLNLLQTFPFDSRLRSRTSN